MAPRQMKVCFYMDAILLNRGSGGSGFDDAFMDSQIFNLGLTFSYPEQNCSGMKWMGRGPYRVWKNRIAGTNYGIWHKDYNNTITGESFEESDISGVQRLPCQSLLGNSGR